MAVERVACGFPLVLFVEKVAAVEDIARVRGEVRPARHVRVADEQIELEVCSRLRGRGGLLSEKPGDRQREEAANKECKMKAGLE